MAIKLIICILSIAVLIAVILFIINEKRRGKLAFSSALENESNKQYSDACFNYAVSSLAGFKSKECDNRIKNLWESSGPLNFDNIKKEIESEYCKYQSCGTGQFEIIVSHIYKKVNYKSKTTT